MCRDEASCLAIHSADIIIVEGILVFYDKELRELIDLKLFVDADSDTRLARRVVRDTEVRERDLDSVLSQYIRYIYVYQIWGRTFGKNLRARHYCESQLQGSIVISRQNFHLHLFETFQHPISV